MERKSVLKWLKIFSVAFIILTIIQLLDLLLFSSIITLNLDSSQYSIFNIIFQSGFMTYHSILLWIIILCVICGFIVLSLSIFRLAKKDVIKNQYLSKFLLLIGLFFIIGGFVNLNFIVLLANSHINTGITNITFQNALYTPSITPLIGTIMWLYFTVAISCFLVSGLIFGGVGLKWMLLIQEEETPQK